MCAGILSAVCDCDERQEFLPPNIYVGTPCFGGVVTTGYMMSMLKLMQHAETAGFSVSINLLGRDLLRAGHAGALQAPSSRSSSESSATHRMFIDADLTFEPQLVHRMLAFDEDVVAGMYPAKAYLWDPPARLRRRAAADGHAAICSENSAKPLRLRLRGPFATGVYCATGFMLMKRSVIERLIEANPDRAYGSDHVYVADKAPRQCTTRCSSA